MKLIKALVLTFTALFLFTGCYTQLQYSQQMKKVSEVRYVPENTSDEQVTERENRSSEVTEEDLTAYTEESDIPIYYKNYYVANWWNDCFCSPYGYNYYSDYWYYDRFHFGSPFYSRHYFYADPYVRWKLRHHRWFHFGSSFTMAWRWGYHYPHHFYGYYDPFLYNYYGYPVAFNNFYYYGRGYGHFNNGGVVRSDNNRRYGPRVIGTSRTVTDTNRARERQSVTNSGNRSATTSAPRTVGTSRTRSSTSSGTVTRTTTNRENSVRTTRTRSVQRKKDDTTTNTTNTRVRSRSDDNSKSVRDNQNRRRTISLPQYVNTRRSNEEIRQRIRSSKVPASSVNIRSSSRERKTFLNRVGSFINNTTSTISNSTTRSVNIRSSSVKKSSSSVSRSKSRSSNTRSRGSVSRSKSSSSSSSSGSRRSRSGGGSSSSDRSRGGN